MSPHVSRMHMHTFLTIHLKLNTPVRLSVKVPAPSDLRVANFSGSDITVRWEAAADDVVSYLIKWISLSGGDLRQVSSGSRHTLCSFLHLCVIYMIGIISIFQLTVDGKSEGAILEGVEEDNEYQVSLSALYADGAQSEAVAIRYSTCEYTHTFAHWYR